MMPANGEPQFFRAELMIERIRVTLLLFILGFIIVVASFLSISLASNGENLLALPDVLAPLSVLLAAVMFYLVWKRLFLEAIGIFVYFFLGSIGLFLAVESTDIGILVSLLALTSIAAAFILRREFFWFAISLNIIMLAWMSFGQGANELKEMATDNALLDSAITFVFSLIPIIVAVIVRNAMQKIEAIALNAQRSATLLEASAVIGQSMSQMLELNDLLNRAAEIIRDRFAFYHVSIFLLDEERRYAHLTASTGEIGERMMARGHRVPVDANSVIGRVAIASDIIVARDAERDYGYSFNELLPDTRSELAAPIKDNEGIVGILDVQSRRVDAFTLMELDALRVIATQLATAIRNARLFEEKERNIRENKRLFIESETNLRENQRLTRQLTKQAWSDYLKTDRRIDGVTLAGQSFQNNADWSEQMLNAGRRRRPITKDTDDMRIVAVPIELRGEVVGAIEIETQQGVNQEDTIDMARAISQRLAVSLDNARLFEESNEASAQEQRVSEIVTQYQSASTVDELLQVTLQGLAETLGAEHGAIRLGLLPDEAFAPSKTQAIEAPAMDEDEQA
jgi:GAF domain-containing protein